MSYIQIKNFGGKDRGLKFKEGTYIKFYELVDMDNYIATFHYAAVYAGLWLNCYQKHEELELSFEQVCDLVDELSTEDKAAVMEVFNNTAYYKKLVEDGQKLQEEEKPAKKKTLKNTTKNA